MTRERQTGAPWDTLFGEVFSHSSEDIILRLCFPYSTGFYVEVGAHNPNESSNTRWFYERGWRGLLVEPNPEFHSLIRNSRIRDVLSPVAASDKDDDLMVLHCNKLHSQRNSLVRDWWSPGEAVRGVTVRTKRLSSIVNDYPEIRDYCDFCSIDVEGWEQKVLEGIDFDTFRPAVFCLEAVRYNPFRVMCRDWEPILRSEGYVLLTHNFQNRFYVRSDAAEIIDNAERAGLFKY